MTAVQLGQSFFRFGKRTRMSIDERAFQGRKYDLTRCEQGSKECNAGGTRFDTSDFDFRAKMRGVLSGVMDSLKCQRRARHPRDLPAIVSNPVVNPARIFRPC